MKQNIKEMVISHSSVIAEVLEETRELNNITKSDFAKKVGKTKQHYPVTIEQLKNETNKVPFNSILKMLNVAGYEIVIRAKN